MRILTVIPAKGTSSRIPRKNLQDLGGKPLVHWTIDAALGVRGFDHYVVVSTDSAEIARVATNAGAHILERPAELCRDPAEMSDVVLHALDTLEESVQPDTVCVLLPTSPFRTSQQVEEALALHGSERCNVVSVCDGRWLRDKLHQGAARIRSVVHDAWWVQRQAGAVASTTIAASTLCLLNGAIWIAAPGRIRTDTMVTPHGAAPYVMDAESGLDIDTPLDLDLARCIAARRSAA